MNERNPNGSMIANDHDAERAEAAWLLDREMDPTALAPSPEIAHDYAELEDLLANLRPLRSKKSLQVDGIPAAPARPAVPYPVTFASSRQAPPRPRWRGAAWKWSVGGATLVAAATMIMLAIPSDIRTTAPPTTAPPTTAPPAVAPPEKIALLEAIGTELEIAKGVGKTVRGAAEEIAVGDHLIVTARPRAKGELRIYQADGPLLVRCPGSPECRNLAGDDGAQVIDLALVEPGRYHVILVIGPKLDALPESMSDYLDAARAAGARSLVAQPIDVH